MGNIYTRCWADHCKLDHISDHRQDSMNQQPIRPIYAKDVAVPFVLAFAGFWVLLSTKYNVWYPQPDVAKFQ